MKAIVSLLVIAVLGLVGYNFYLNQEVKELAASVESAASPAPSAVAPAPAPAPDPQPEPTPEPEPDPELVEASEPPALSLPDQAQIQEIAEEIKTVVDSQAGAITEVLENNRESLQAATEKVNNALAAVQSVANSTGELSSDTVGMAAAAVTEALQSAGDLVQSIDGQLASTQDNVQAVADENVATAETAAVAPVVVEEAAIEQVADAEVAVAAPAEPTLDDILNPQNIDTAALKAWLDEQQINPFVVAGVMGLVEQVKTDPAKAEQLINQVKALLGQ